jgi:hypothetical protein
MGPPREVRWSDKRPGAQEDTPGRFMYAQAHRVRLGRGNETDTAMAKRLNLSRRLTCPEAHGFNFAVTTITAVTLLAFRSRPFAALPSAGDGTRAYRLPLSPRWTCKSQPSPIVR